MSIIDKLIHEWHPNGGAEFKPIKEVYKVLKGTPITSAKMKEIESPDGGGDVRIFSCGKTFVDAYECDIPKANIIRVPCVLVQSKGAIDVIYCERPCTFKDMMWAYTHEDKAAVKFLYYVLKNNLGFFRGVASGKGTIPGISQDVTDGFEIPVLPIEVQREIVRILDRVSVLCDGNISHAPDELAARLKQFEYYKGKQFEALAK